MSPLSLLLTNTSFYKVDDEDDAAGWSADSEEDAADACSVELDVGCMEKETSPSEFTARFVETMGSSISD